MLVDSKLRTGETRRVSRNAGNSTSILIVMVLLLWLPGCSRKKPGDAKSGDIDQRKSQSASKLDIEEIQNAYSNAKAYSDSARIVLRYTLNGLPIEESHPFHTRMDRDGNGSLHWFKIKVNSRQDTSLGRIVDLKTQNFDGQVKSAQQSHSDFVATLKQDDIALHYLSGSDDIPWGENNADPVISVLAVAHELFHGKDQHWFQKKNLVESQSVDVKDQTYIDATFRSKWGNLSCRIDPTRKLILGFRLPKNLLDEKISSSPAVTAISFAMLFENATFQGPDTSKIANGCKLMKSEKAVRNFVKLPEAFPSEAIGKTIENWKMVDRTGKLFDRSLTLGATNVFLFGDPATLSPRETDAIEALAKNQLKSNLAWILPQTVPLAETRLPFSRMGLFADRANDVLRFFQPSQSTFLFASDSKGVIQYVAMYSEDWLDDVDGVLSRLEKGDDVAREMHSEYAKYFADYQQRLGENSISPAFLNQLQK